MNLYGIFFGSSWVMTRSKKQALKSGKANGGVVIVQTNAYGPGSVRTWDAPTFRTTGTLLADFTKETKRFTLSRVRLNQGGYTDRGQYFGVEAPLYYAQSEEGYERYYRAYDRESAKEQVRADYPGVTVTFYR